MRNPDERIADITADLGSLKRLTLGKIKNVAWKVPELKTANRRRTCEIQIVTFVSAERQARWNSNNGATHNRSDKG